GLVFLVELVAVAVALADLRGAVNLRGPRAGQQLAGVRPEPHGAPQVLHTEQVLQLVDHLVLGLGLHLGGVGAGQAADVAGVFGHRPLEPVADAEIGRAAAPGEFGRRPPPARAPRAEAPGHQDAVHAGELAGGVARLQLLRLHPAPHHADAVAEAAVGQRLVQALVGVLEGDVFADDA